ncbi:MAG TPA: hypothetical protein VN853_09265 [Polyangia bacterium]|nr:hypothetical protein [Polyangia bacterium]
MRRAGRLAVTLLALAFSRGSRAAPAAPVAAPAPAGTPPAAAPRPPAKGSLASAAPGAGAPPALAPPPHSLIHEAAPRPEAAIRVQQRFAAKARLVELSGGFEYLSRGDFYNSPGARISGAYYPIESLGIEARISHYWSSLDATAREVISTTGTLPDSHAPGWVGMLGARYSIGYGKLLVGGLGGVIHFEPQAFVHGGLHDNDGDVGPSADFGLGFLVFLMPRLFVRADVPVTLDWEYRYSRTVTVFGTAPTLSVGGFVGGP